MVRIRIKFQSHKLKRYFKENFGAPFIIGFQILVVACAYLLVREAPTLAKEVAIYAYYLLIAGTILQLASFLRSKKEKNKSG